VELLHKSCHQDKDIPVFSSLPSTSSSISHRHPFEGVNGVSVPHHLLIGGYSFSLERWPMEYTLGLVVASSQTQQHSLWCLVQQPILGNVHLAKCEISTHTFYKWAVALLAVTDRISTLMFLANRDPSTRNIVVGVLIKRIPSVIGSLWRSRIWNQFFFLLLILISVDQESII